MNFWVIVYLQLTFFCGYKTHCCLYLICYGYIGVVTDSNVSMHDVYFFAPFIAVFSRFLKLVPPVSINESIVLSSTKK